MTKEELKKKICKIIAPYVSAWGEDERIADALIAAGLKFDTIVSHTATFDLAQLEYINSLERRCAKSERRAEVAERAFDDLADEIYQHDVRPICDKEFFKQARFEQAEKELAEEGKDD